MHNLLEIKRTMKSSIAPNSNVVFNVASPYSEGIVYDPASGEITLTQPGQYFICWWVATNTSLTGCMQFALQSSQGDTIIGCSPTKRGQVVGFGDVTVTTASVKLSLVNTGDCQANLTQNTPVTAELFAVRIPEDGINPTFGVKETTSLAPGSSATASVQEDTGNPNNWLFSFGIPNGATGAAGVTPHIDTGTGNWFIGTTNTGVHAQGPQGDVGPTGVRAYGQINSAPATISLPQGVPTTVPMPTEGDFHNVTMASNSIVIMETGTYLLSYSLYMLFTFSAATDLKFAVRAGTTDIDETVSHASAPVGTYPASYVGSTIAKLTKDDVINIAITSSTGITMTFDTDTISSLILYKID